MQVFGFNLKIIHIDLENFTSKSMVVNASNKTEMSNVRRLPRVFDCVRSGCEHCVSLNNVNMCNKHILRLR